MKRFLTALIAVLMFAAGGCGDSYYKCLKCGAVYKQPAFRHGFPGQTNTRTCRSIDDSPNQTCDGRLIYCTEADSGWNEDRFQKRGNEIPEGSPW